MRPQYQRLGDIEFTKIDKVSSELLTFTYGALVMQLLSDLEDADQTSKQLDKMGYNIGVRIVDEFLARTNIRACQNFEETGEVIAKVAFKMFLGVTAECRYSANPAEAGGESLGAFNIVLGDNPLTDFVEVPPEHSDLVYCNILCGVIRGALEMVGMKVEASIVTDVLRGDDSTVISVVLKEVVEEQYHDDES